LIENKDSEVDIGYTMANTSQSHMHSRLKTFLQPECQRRFVSLEIFDFVGLPLVRINTTGKTGELVGRKYVHIHTTQVNNELMLLFFITL